MMAPMKQARIDKLRALVSGEDFSDVIALKSVALEALTAVERLNSEPNEVVLDGTIPNCPYCNHESKVEWTDEALAGAIYFYVQCQDDYCLAAGPQSRIEQKAIVAWVRLRRQLEKQT